MVKVRLNQWAMAAPDRAHLEEYEAGKLYDVPEFLADFFKDCGYVDPNYSYEKEVAEEERKLKAREVAKKKEKERIWESLVKGLTT